MVPRTADAPAGTSRSDSWGTDEIVGRRRGWVVGNGRWVGWRRWFDIVRRGGFNMVIGYDTRLARMSYSDIDC